MSGKHTDPSEDDEAHATVEWTPAFPGQRPPFKPGNEYAFRPGNEYVFKPGNELRTTHGAYSPRKLLPIAAEIVAGVLADPEMTHLHSPAFRMGLEAMAMVEARCRLLSEWVDTLSIQAASESDRGKTSPLELLRSWEESASRQRSKLGLDPASASRIGRNMATGRAAAADTARIMAELHAIQQASEKGSKK